MLGGRGHLGRDWPGWPGRARKALAKGPKGVRTMSLNAQRRPGPSSHLSPLALGVAGEAAALGPGAGAAALRPRPAGAVRGPAAGLALRARVPDRGRRHDAAVPAQALRRPPHPPLPVRALAVPVHLHQDLGAHPGGRGGPEGAVRTQALEAPAARQARDLTAGAGVTGFWGPGHGGEACEGQAIRTRGSL